MELTWNLLSTMLFFQVYRSAGFIPFALLSDVWSVVFLLSYVGTHVYLFNLQIIIVTYLKAELLCRVVLITIQLGDLQLV